MLYTVIKTFLNVFKMNLGDLLSWIEPNAYEIWPSLHDKRSAIDQSADASTMEFIENEKRKAIMDN